MNIGKKNKIIGLLIIFVSIIVSLFALVPLENVKTNLWMKKVNDDTRIVDLSIPGTHDSGAMHSIFDVAGKCQDVSIKGQVNMGVRFFDLRLQLVNDEFKIVHSFVDQNLTFKSVIKDLASFIRNNKSEFLIISIKKEADELNSKRDFEEVLLEDMKQYNDVISYDSSLPNTLKEARGKIYIMARYSSSIGIPCNNGWKDSTTFILDSFYIQDNYCIDNVEEKKSDIISMFEYAKDNDEKIVLNFTSCYLDNSFPPSYAGTAALNINPWLETYLSDYDDKLGIVVIDFINSSLVELISRRNYDE